MMLLVLLASLGNCWSTATAEVRLLRGEEGESERPNAEAKGANMLDGMASAVIERERVRGGDKRRRKIEKEGGGEREKEVSGC